MLKILDELSKDELKDVFDEADLLGELKEAELVVSITISLFNVGKNPFNFQFEIDAHVNPTYIVCLFCITIIYM